jgi:hypothetical protein
MNRNLKSLALITVFAAVTVATAKADTISGSISISGADSYNKNSVTFVGNGSVNAVTGTLTSLGTCQLCVALTDFNLKPTTFSPTTIFTVTNNGETVSLLLSSLTTVKSNGNMLNVVGEGTLSQTGYDSAQGTIRLTSQDGKAGVVSFSATTMVAPTPEPGTLMLLGTGLVGSAGALYNRRRRPAAIAAA